MAATIVAGPSWLKAKKSITHTIMERGRLRRKASDADGGEALLSVHCRPQDNDEPKLNEEEFNRALDLQAVNADDSVAVEPTPQPTSSARSVKQRVTWTTEMNEFVTRCYYRLTKLGKAKTPYSAELHRIVIKEYPQLRSKTPQNIVDQRRSIFTNSRLSPETIDRIKKEVGIELGMIAPEISEEENLEAPQVEEPTSAREQQWMRNHAMLHGMNVSAKPRLPKLIFRRDTYELISEINEIIQKKLIGCHMIEEIHSIIYTSAYTTIQANNQKIAYEEDEKKNKKTDKQAWERRLESRIEGHRKEIGILTQYLRPNRSPKVERKGTVLVNKHKTEDNPDAIAILDWLKQKVAALAKRLRRYKACNDRRRQNNKFETNQKLFYRQLDQNSAGSGETQERLPKESDILDFWKGIWGTSVEHKKGTWFYEEKTKTAKVRTMLNHIITEKDVLEAVKKTKNWKTPGPDMIHNFWFKKFTSTHKHLAKAFTAALEDPINTPDFMTTGLTFLLPKTEKCSEDPAKYRPITCLPTMYKILTSIIATKVYEHLNNNNLLSEEQKGCRKQSMGAKEQLIIDSIVTNTAKKRKDTLLTAYVDYQKAFDSVPHSWLIEILKLYKINPILTGFLEYAMTQWKTNIILRSGKTTLNAGSVPIRRGIFQGDALSPLWFCMAIRPLTSMLNKQNKGYQLETPGIRLSHLWYMDDLKLYAGKKEHLQLQLDCVKKFSNDIKMTFGLDKCRTSFMEKGKWTKHEGYGEEHQRITGMEEEEQYKYLGYAQARGIDHVKAKRELTNAYFKRTTSILRTELSGKNTSLAVNAYSTSVLTYSFGIINWTATELDALDTRTRVLFRKFRSHHPNSAIERFHLPRKEGGRGIPSIRAAHFAQIENLRKYFMEKKESSVLHATIVKMDNKITPLKLNDLTYDPKQQYSDVSTMKGKWRGKLLHGRYRAAIEKDEIDTKASLQWLNTNIFKETEGFIIAIQDQVIATRSYRSRIMHERIQNARCRMCNIKEESIDHLMAGCGVLAPKQYLERHNNVAKILHQQIIKKYLPEEYVDIPYYKYQPSCVLENNSVRLYWNRKIITDRTIPCNIPDIVLTLKNNQIAYIIDIAVPLATNISATHREKINKYLPLADEVKEMWDLKAVTIVPVILGTTGEIPKKLHEGLETLGMPEKLYLAMQKAVVLSTCAIIRRVISSYRSSEDTQPTRVEG